MKYFDSHTHINGDELYPHRQEYLTQFVQIGGKGLVDAGANEQYNERGIEIAKQAEILFKDIVVKTTIGYHPGECGIQEPTTVPTSIITQENIDDKINVLRSLYAENKKYIVAIGECGIDTYYPGSENSLPIQKKLFALQCDLAKEFMLPLMVHIRKDFESAFEILKHYHDMTIYIHCRGFGPEEIEKLLIESGTLNWKLFFGFCGNITYKNAQNLRDSLIKVPLDHLLLETDAPWLSPQVVRGTTNHPANVRYIYDFVSELLHISPEMLSQQIAENFSSLYKTS